MTAGFAVLLLAVGKHRVGLAADSVLGLHRMAAAVPLPGAPSCIDGVIDVRGQAVAVLNLRCRLGLPTQPINPDEHLVVVRLAERVLALRVDRALDVVRIPADTQDTAAGLPDTGLAGLARLDDGLLLLHDVETFLDHAEAAALDEALAALAVAS